MEFTEPYKSPKHQPLPPLKRPKQTPWLRRILLCVAGLLVIGILIGMLLPVTRRGVPAAARRTVCANNERQLVLALLNYEEAHGHFPPAYIADEDGKPMHSWRVLILPFLERKDLLDRYSMDEPWNGPNNLKLADEIDGIFSCPSHRPGTEESNRTSYCLVTGPGTLFESDNEPVFGDFVDGSSNTAILVEVNHGNIHWMEPEDITIDEALKMFELASQDDQASNHHGLINVAYGDGSTHSLDVWMARAELMKLFLVADEASEDELPEN